MKKRMLAMLLAISLSLGITSESVYALEQDKATQEVTPESETLEEVQEVTPESETLEETQEATEVEKQDMDEAADETVNDEKETVKLEDMSVQEKNQGTSYYAQTISPNTITWDSLSDSDDENYYKFYVSSAGNISLSFGKEYDSDTYHGWKVILYDGSQKELMSRIFECGNTATETTCKVGVPAGNYYVKVQNKSNWSSDWTDVMYSLKVKYTSGNAWETEVNDDVANTDVIAVGKTYYGSLRECEDIDYYKFSVGSAGNISLSFGKEYDSDTYHRWKVTLYDGSQKELMSRTFECGNTVTETTCKVGVPAGSYYVKVQKGYHWTDVMYSLKVNYTSSNTWETEFNDDISTADRIAAGNTYHGSIRESEDEDYYIFTLPSAAYVSLSLGSDYEDDKNNGWNVNLYNSSMVLQQENQHTCETTKLENFGTIKLPAGTYYIKVTGKNWYWTDVTYHLKVNTAFTKTKSTVSASNSASGIRLKWNKVPEGNGYKIYRKSGSGSYSLIKTITNAKTTSYTDKSVKGKNGTKYTYIVRAYRGSAQNSYKAKSIYRMTAPMALKVKNVKGSKISVKWKKNSKASGYQIKYVNGSKSKTKTYSGKNAVSKTISGLKKGKTYKVYVRAYKKVSGTKYYSAWSSAKSVKIKK